MVSGGDGGSTYETQQSTKNCSNTHFQEPIATDCVNNSEKSASCVKSSNEEKKKYDEQER